MKNTNIKKLSVVCATLCMLLLTQNSCKMDIYPEDCLTAETYFHTGTELQLFTNKFYEIMPSGSTMYEEQGEHFVGDSPSREIQGTRIIPATDSKWSFTTLRDINYLLAHSSNCTDESARKHYEGVAHFFRAYFYFNMLQYFGEVPWYSEVIGSADTELLNKPRDSREIVVNKILSDLDTAFDYLPTTHTVYEVNAWTALALKSRVATFEGTFRKYHDGDPFNPNHLPWEGLLQKGADAAEQFINDGGYQITRNSDQPYRKLFASDEADVSEFVWARRYNTDLSITNNSAGWSLTRKTGFTRRFTNLYLNADGTRFTDKEGYDTIQYLKECGDRDPRMAQTLHTPGYVQYGAEKSYAVDLKQTFTGYKYIKYIMTGKYNTWDASIAAMPILRYAEVLLNFAECKAELGTITQQDLDKSVNLLRDRVNMPHIILKDALANPDSYMTNGYGFTSPVLISHPMKGIVLELRRERIIETPLEGLHYWDIMRWKEGHLFAEPLYGMYFPGEGKYDLTGDGKPNIMISKTKKSGGIGVTTLVIGEDITLSEGDKGHMWAHSGLKFVWDENKDYLYPIPTEERVLTNGKLTQNPGWIDGLSF